MRARETPVPPGASIFPHLTLDRRLVHWEDWLETPTPVERAPSGAWYKREDLFAPLGPGGVNGAKLRQLVWLVAAAAEAGAAGVLTGASVLSPQISSTAAVARHFGLPCTLVLGGTTPTTALRHEQVKIAVALGAELICVPVGYNPVLQATVRRLLDTPAYAGWYQLCYGITTPASADDDLVAAFHSLGAQQVRTFPAEVDTLHIAAGSCNTSTSVLLGLALYPPPGLRRLVLYQIGPDRAWWQSHRFWSISRALGVNVEGALRRYDRAIWDVHGAGLTYGMRRPWTLDGMLLHPTYEGKILAARRGRPFGPGELFWIIGSEPHLAPMLPAIPPLEAPHALALSAR